MENNNPENNNTLERLQKILSASTPLSRRAAEKAIREGRVRLNGQVVHEMGIKAHPEEDQIELDFEPVRMPREKTTLLLHKPRRVMTTRSDPQGRRTIMDLLPPPLRKLKPVGRLDFESEGLLLLTDDGDLAQKLMHPRFEVQKIYHVRVKGIPSPETLNQLTHSVQLCDAPGKFESIRMLSRPRSPDQASLEVIVREGRNRFIRRMMKAVDHPVIRLRRIRVGQLSLGEMRPGEFRQLTPKEVERLLS